MGIFHKIGMKIKNGNLPQIGMKIIMMSFLNMTSPSSKGRHVRPTKKANIRVIPEGQLLECEAMILTWKLHSLEQLHSRNLTLIPRIATCKGSYLFNTIIFGIHVSFLGCIDMFWVGWTHSILTDLLNGRTPHDLEVDLLATNSIDGTVIW